MDEAHDSLARSIESIWRETSRDLFALDESELFAQWYWSWDENRSLAWNTYAFHRTLTTYASRCRRWEEHHNGSCCVVERVRDKYLMPRIEAFIRTMREQSDQERNQ